MVAGGIITTPFPWCQAYLEAIAIAANFKKREYFNDISLAFSLYILLIGRLGLMDWIRNFRGSKLKTKL
jgi:hypothetical protein